MELHFHIGDDLEEFLRAFAGARGITLSAASRILLHDALSERLRIRAEAADAYARQNADVHRENMRLYDEIAALREKREQ